MRLGLFCLLFVFSQVSSAVGITIGPEIKLLGKLQGKWVRQCYETVDGNARVYAQDWLTVSYTAMSFKTMVFRDRLCNNKLTEYSVELPFVIRGEAQAAAETARRLVGDRRRPGGDRRRPRRQ